MAEQNPYSEAPALELADAMGQLVGGMSAIHSQVLAMAAEFDRHQYWRDDGAPDMIAWLRTRFCLSHRTARDWAQAAASLRELPHCSQAYAEGRLSWDQLKPVTKIATPETDAQHAAEAPGASVAALETAARRAREIERAEAEAQEARRSLRWCYTGSNGFRLSAHLPAADGAIVVAALESVAEKLPELNLNGQHDPHDSRMADSLVLMSSGNLAATDHADRACVVVHVEEGKAELQGGHPIHSTIAERLCCDGRIEVVVEGQDGVPIGIGRASRAVPPWLWRMLMHRDGGRCRFCGCTCWLQAHHIRFWSLGGRTDLANMIVTCSRCHKLFHEGGWTIEGDPNGKLTFIRPDGRPLDSGPPALRSEVYEELLRAVSAPTFEEPGTPEEPDDAEPHKIVSGRSETRTCKRPARRATRRSRKALTTSLR